VDKYSEDFCVYYKPGEVIGGSYEVI
jgi:hypothetical protein